MKKRYKIMMYTFLIAIMIIGGLLVVYLIGKEEGEYSFEWVIAVIKGVVGGAIGAFVIKLLYSKWRMKRKSNVPEVDERSVLLMKRYLLIVLYFVLFGSSALLMALYGMGIHTIETGMLIVYMMILFLVIGIGAVIVTRL